jgi:hypothetical protein
LVCIRPCMKTFFFFLNQKSILHCVPHFAQQHRSRTERIPRLCHRPQAAQRHFLLHKTLAACIKVESLFILSNKVAGTDRACTVHGVREVVGIHMGDCSRDLDKLESNNSHSQSEKCSPAVVQILRPLWDLERSKFKGQKLATLAAISWNMTSNASKRSNDRHLASTSCSTSLCPSK